MLFEYLRQMQNVYEITGSRQAFAFLQLNKIKK